MRPKSDPTVELAKEVRLWQDEHLRASTLTASIRSRVLATAPKAPRSFFGLALGEWFRFAVPVCAAAVVGLVLWTQRESEDESLTFSVGSESGQVDRWIEARGTEPTELHFSDGTRARMARASRARVNALGRAGARVEIAEGRVDFEVRKRPRAQWDMVAGPFLVQVTGTAFAITWEPAEERFELAVTEGRVLVTGPVVGQRHPVAAGEQLTVRVPASVGATRDLAVESTPTSVSRHPGDTTAPAGPTSTQAPATSEPPERTERGPREPGNETRNPDTAPASAEPTASPSPAWLLAARAGHYTEAARLARELGLDAILRTADAPELLALGDAERLARDAALAQRTYLAVRTRFPSSDTAARAAFALGQLSFDAEHEFRRAITWFSTYLSERPNGALAREALGRTLECHQRLHERTQAQPVARRYLEQYPDGPHADLARSILPP